MRKVRSGFQWKLLHTFWRQRTARRDGLSALRRDASAGGAAAGETAASAGATSNVKAGGATAKIADSDASLQPHHHMLLSIFELIALCMCCGCICRGGTCIRLLQKFRGNDNKLPSL